jgi:hypothetical protein
MTVSNRHGNIDIELEEPPKTDIDVKAQYSDVTIQVPANSPFRIEGHTRYGNIDSEFDSPTINSSGREYTIRGQQGIGGPRIDIDTQHGNIRLEKRG